MNEAPCSSPRMQGKQQIGSFPVKNTFIHYGTPVRGTTGCGGTPKTVPPDFAPEAEWLDLSLAPFPYGTQPAPSAPLASPMPNTGGRPGPDAWRAGADREGQSTRGRGVAPLRLFDFLPSPTIQAPPSVLHMQIATTQVAIPNGVSVGMPNYSPAPMAFSADGSLQQQILQQPAGPLHHQPTAWPSWTAGGFSAAAPMGAPPLTMAAPAAAPQILTGVSMSCSSTGAVSMMAPQAPVYMSAPAAHPPPSMPACLG
jgi:hypothetical protein